MVAALILLIVFDVDAFATVVLIVILTNICSVIIVVIRLQATLSLKVTLFTSLGTEASASLSHLIEEVITAALLASWLRIIVIIKDLLVFCTFLVHLQVFDDFLVFLSSLDFL